MDGSEQQHVENETTPPQPLGQDEIISAIRRQIEYYFSKENLQQDPFLTSHMDAAMSVPIPVVMKFSKIKALTQDESLLAKALENSTVVNIVDGKIKATMKGGGRSTIILREIPSDAPEEEVREIFSYEGSKRISSIRSDIGDTWFVVMESEDDAKVTLMDLRTKKRVFRGQPVRGRVKSDTVVRSFYPLQTGPAPVMYPGGPIAMGMPGMVPPFPFAGPVPPGVIEMMPPYGYGLVPNGMVMAQGIGGAVRVRPQQQVVDEADGISSAGAVEGSGVSMNGFSGLDSGSSGAAQGGRSRIQPQQTGDRQGADRRSGAGNSSVGGKTGLVGNSRGSENRERRNTGNTGRGSPEVAGAGDKRGRGSVGNSASAPSHANGSRRDGGGAKGTAAPQIEISAANFPPLHAVALDDTPVPTPGFKGEFIKYTVDEMVEIAHKIKDAPLSDSIKPSDHPLALNSSPNSDLLLRQRTFSIDETREQLRQGRPVRREAIAEGSSTDYGSLIYGDGFQEAVPVVTVAAIVKGTSSSGAAVDIVPVYANQPPATAATAAPVSAEAAPALVVVAAPASTSVVSEAGGKKSPGSWAALVMASTATQTDAVSSKKVAAAPAAPSTTAADKRGKQASGATAGAARSRSDSSTAGGGGSRRKREHTAASGADEKTSATAADKKKDAMDAAKPATEVKEEERPTMSAAKGANAASASSVNEGTVGAVGTQTETPGGGNSSSDANQSLLLRPPPTADAVSPTAIPSTSMSTSSSAPSSSSGWGGKPTFANILKQQAAAGEIDGKPSALALPSEMLTVTTASSGAVAQRTQRSSGSSSNNNNNNSSKNNNSSSHTSRQGQGSNRQGVPVTRKVNTSGSSGSGGGW